MRVGWYVARATLRRRAPSVLIFIVLSGLAGGLVLAGIAGARHTERAFDEMVEEYRVPNAAVFPEEPDDAAEVTSILERMPQVRAYGTTATAIVAMEEPPGSGSWVADLAFSAVDDRGLLDIQRSLVVEGRHMDPTAADEVEVNEAWAEVHDAEVGTRIELGLVPYDQLDAAGNGLPVEPSLPPRSYEVVGIVRKPGDLAPARPGVEGTIDAGDAATLYLSPAFWEQHGDSVASYGSGVMVQLEEDEDIEALSAALADITAQVSAEGGESGAAIPATTAAIDVEARALLATSLLFGVVAILLLAQAVRRRAAAQGETLAAIGMDRRGLVLAGAIEWGLIGMVAGVIALSVAVALSPLAPVGISRRASTSTGLHVDGSVLLPGALLVLGLFTAGGALMGWVASRRLGSGRTEMRPARLAGRASASIRRPGAGIGVRFALEPGTGQQAVPIRSAILSGVLGVTALVAAATFTASLDRIVEEPRLRGWTWDYDVGNYSEPETAAEGRELLLANPGVREMSGWLTDVVDLNGQEVPLLLLDDQDGLVGPQMFEGRLPTGPGEIALASGTLDALGLSVGDEVEAVGPNGDAVGQRIVGESVGIAVIDDTASLDEGAIVTFDGVTDMLLPTQVPWATGYLVRLADGEGGEAGLAQLREDFPGTVFGARSTADIENLRRVQWLPRLAVVGVGLLALGSIAHSLVSAVRVRRRELAVLKSFGMRGSQLVEITVAQATTLAVIALVLGIPAGVIAGRALWRLAAEQIGTFAGPVVDGVPLVLGSLAVIVLSVLLAVIPGRTAARTPTAAILRVE